MKPRERVMLDHEAIDRALRRIAHEIVERNKGARDVALVGVRSGGEGMAKRLCSLLGEIESNSSSCGYIDVTMYRDDIFHSRTNIKVKKTVIDFPVEGKTIILVDDVLFTGRTIRAAMDALMDLGRPKSIQLAVLIDRGHRELPIRPDYVGRNVPTARGDLVNVSVGGEKDEVLLVEGDDELQKKEGE